MVCMHSTFFVLYGKIYVDEYNIYYDIYPVIFLVFRLQRIIDLGINDIHYF